MSETGILSDSISNKIKNLIRNGNYQPGQKIPNEQELVAMLNVSRSTIREAVKILASKNILEIKRGKGTYVCMIPGVDSDPFGFDFMDKSNLLVHLCELRTMLEPQVAVLSAQRATKQELDEMKTIVDDMEMLYSKVSRRDLSSSDVDELSDKDAEFHNLLYRMSHNPALDRIVPAVNKAIMESYTDLKFRNTSREHKHISTHKRIYEALLKRDEALVLELCRRHMANGTMMLLGEIPISK